MITKAESITGEILFLIYAGLRFGEFKKLTRKDFI
jgi:hypothetical protein